MSGEAKRTRDRVIFGSGGKPVVQPVNAMKCNTPLERLGIGQFREFVLAAPSPLPFQQSLTLNHHLDSLMGIILMGPVDLIGDLCRRGVLIKGRGPGVMCLIFPWNWAS